MPGRVMEALFEDQEDLAANVCADVRIPVFSRQVQPHLRAVVAEQVAGESPHAMGQIAEPILIRVDGPDDVAHRIHQFARDVRVAWSDSLTAYHQLDVTAELLRDATMALDLAQGRYNLGLSSIVELTQAQLNLTEAEVENLGAKYDYQKSYAVLRYATGMLR